MERQEVIERFWNKVEKTDSCWTWQGAKTRGGYGMFPTAKNHKLYDNYYVHRISYYLANGDFDARLRVCHRCDNPSCVNPDHLFLGTQSENMRDMFSKGRDNVQAKIVRGEKHGQSKLNWDIVRAIRKEYAEGNISQGKLAKRYGVNQTTIRDVVLNKNWKE
jgi:hypothetical protein